MAGEAGLSETEGKREPFVAHNRREESEKRKERKKREARTHRAGIVADANDAAERSESFHDW